MEYLHACARHYPGMRGLILRKTRASLTETGLVTFEEKVVPAGSSVLVGAERAYRKRYRYPNGSELVIGGLDNPIKVMSSEYDLIYIQEAIEVDEPAWETCSSRLRNGVMPYSRLIADTNPDAPTHWLRKRAESGKCRMLESQHEENPVYWDHREKRWTPLGLAYMTRLDALTGVRYQRLRLGLWVAAEGMVYEEWEPARHRINRFVIPPEWPRYWVCDFGYTHPFVWQCWAEDHDGRLFRYKEIYQTGRLVEDHARDILAAAQGEPRPRAIICDHDAEDRATLERHLGMRTVAAFKGVSPGIQAVAARLRPAGDGRARIYFLRDSLVRRDASLAEKKLPTCSEEEMSEYVWNLTGGRTKGEEPVKEKDHGADCVRYVVAAVDSVGKRPQKALGW